jgi:hypothetical protein
MGGSAELPPGVVPEGRARNAALGPLHAPLRSSVAPATIGWAKPADGPSEGCLGADVGA